MFPIRCTVKSVHFATRPVVPYPQAFLLRRHNYTDKSQPPPTRYQLDPDADAGNVQNKFAGHAMSALRDMRKVVMFLACGVLIIGTVTGTVFEAAHFWIEGKMCEPAGDDARRWGWEVESWSDVNTGGTSRELGFLGRHAARAAWFSLRYGEHFTTTATISQVPSGDAEQGSLNIVDASLESARIFLEKAMTRIRDEQGRVRMDSVGVELLERHAAVMERIGTRPALIKAREEYSQVFDGRVGQKLAEARLAVKLGDLSERLGHDEDALSWWRRGIDLTKDHISTPSTLLAEQSLKTQDHPPRPTTRSASKTSILPEHPPSLPGAQRTLVAAILSLSAYYSKRKQLEEAQYIQEYAIRLIDSMVPQSKVFSSASSPVHSPGQTLHQMFLLHRKALLILHHGEVSFALGTSTTKARKSLHKTTLTDLLTSASSSEVVAQILTGLSLSHPDIPSSYLSSDVSSSTSGSSAFIPHPPSWSSPLSSMYLGSPALSAPAASVLRDARLAAAVAWDLCGVLYSNMGGADEDVKALECFERALGWVGDDPSESGSREGISVKEWRALWARFIEARKKVLKKPK